MLIEKRGFSLVYKNLYIYKKLKKILYENFNKRSYLLEGSKDTSVLHKNVPGRDRNVNEFRAPELTNFDLNLVNATTSDRRDTEKNE